MDLDLLARAWTWIFWLFKSSPRYTRTRTNMVPVTPHLPLPPRLRGYAIGSERLRGGSSAASASKLRVEAPKESWKKGCLQGFLKC